MNFIADFHIHSHYSRATSRDLVPEQLSHWAQKKGIALVGTGDFTHPGWVRELREKLTEAEEGLFRLRPELERHAESEVPPLCRSLTRFILSGEISCIYKRAGKTRKVHHLILMPDFDVLERMNRHLARIGNITSDGRPILGLDSRDLLEIVLESSDRAIFIPAHIWTPWFSLFGSKSGFDAIEECFGDLAAHIRALETGLSSDPLMNRRLSALDPYLLVSNSDAHSPAKLGREANLFNAPLDYPGVVEAMDTGRGFLGTVEFFPEEGKYHLDGHRKCAVRFEPQKTRDCNGLCPKCGKPLTVGVLSRVHDLADRNSPVLNREFRSLIPLSEILSEILSCGPATARVLSAYENLLERLGPELAILMDCARDAIQDAGGPLLAEAIDRMRRKQVIREEGYDGEYGVIRLFREGEKNALAGQGSLFGDPAGKAAVRRRASPVPKPSSREAPSLQPKERRSSPDPVLDPLNPEQREAVLHEGCHLLIVAGPGTGKTMTLAHRIARLIRSGAATPDRILALTFTNKAAREMKARISGMCNGEGKTRNRRGGEAGKQGNGESANRGVGVSTFHGFCMEVLRRQGDRAGISPDFTLCSEADSLALARQVVSEGEGKKRAGQGFLKRIPQLKIASVMGDLLDPAHADMLPYFREYQQRLRSLGMLDLDDLEAETLRLFREHPAVAAEVAGQTPWIFVDEYQDTSPVQVAILKAIVGSGSSSPCTLNPAPCTVHLCAIGDPDQAIYGFRGGDVQGFLHFAEDFPGAAAVRLVRNYRSTRSILESAAAVLEKQDPLEAQSGAGDPVRIASCRTAGEEAETIVAEVERLLGGISHFSLDSGRVASHEERGGHTFGDVAVLFRLNAQGDTLEEAFRRAGIPYVRSGERPLTRRYPVHILWRFLLALRHPEVPLYRDAYLALPEMKGRDGESMLARGLQHGAMREILERALALHAFDLSAGEGGEALRRLNELADGFQGRLGSFLDMLSLDRAIDHEALPGDRVALMSLHASKGLEWPVVFIAGCEEGLLPCTLFGERDDEEEKRLFYVGMTRAQRHLVLSHAARRSLKGRPLEAGPSPFLRLIPKGHLAPLERESRKRGKSPARQLGLFK